MNEKATVGQTQLDRIESMLTILMKRTAPKKRRTSKDINYSAGFELCWECYPSRGSASNPKVSAYGAYNARVREGVAQEDLLAGVQRYAKYCEVMGSDGTEYVMQAVRFFGRNKEYELDFKPTPKRVVVPFGEKEMLQFARDHGLGEAKQTEGWQDYRARLQRLIDERVNDRSA